MLVRADTYLGQDRRVKVTGQSSSRLQHKYVPFGCGCTLQCYVFYGSHYDVSYFWVVSQILWLKRSVKKQWKGKNADLVLILTKHRITRTRLYRRISSRNRVRYSPATPSTRRVNYLRCVVLISRTDSRLS